MPKGTYDTTKIAENVKLILRKTNDAIKMVANKKF